jgi:hypothetical protein
MTAVMVMGKLLPEIAELEGKTNSDLARPLYDSSAYML